MVRGYEIKEVQKKIYKVDELLIIGSPKGVGTTTILCELVAHKMFFNEGFEILYLTSSDKDKINSFFKIQKEYLKYGTSLSKDGDILYEDTKNGSIIVVKNWNGIENINSIDKKYDLVIIDNDFGSGNIYRFFKADIEDPLGLIPEYGKTIIINTYDSPDSIFYKISDKYKVKTYSEYSNKNIEEIQKNPSNIINLDKKIYGDFKDRY